MITTLLVAFATVVAADPANVAVDATGVLKKWAAAEEDVHAVHATFVHYRYDSVFGTFTKGSGEVYWSSRNDGFWAFTPDNAAYVSRDAERWLWKGNVVTVIDDERKKYDQFPRRLSLFGTQPIRHVTTWYPFLPGLPNKNAINDWEFQIVAHTEKEVRLKATPPKALTKQFRSCELILRKPDMTLHAVKYTYSTGKRESVLVFETVKRNPPRMPDLDLSGYTVGIRVLPR